MKHTILFILVTLSVSFYSCSQNSNGLLPGVKGKANDIVVVMNGPKWESEPGNIVREYVSQFVPGLPLEEPKFNYLFVPHANFDKVYKGQRNILITKIGPDYKEKVLIQHDIWAKTQLVITMMAPNEAAFIELYKKKGSEINEIITTAELKRLADTYKANPEKSIVKKLSGKHHVNLTVPKGYRINADTSNFIWLRNDYRDIIEGILVYYYPYTDTNTFTTEFLINKRNEFLKKYVEGEAKGSYMSTEMRFEFDEMEFELNGNRYTKEIRGLWKMDGGFAMGGPFLSISQYDEVNKRIVTVEGFVFAPAHKKRNIMRRVEAIVYSLDFKEKPEEK